MHRLMKIVTYCFRLMGRRHAFLNISDCQIFWQKFVLVNNFVTRYYINSRHLLCLMLHSLPFTNNGAGKKWKKVIKGTKNFWSTLVFSFWLRFITFDMTEHNDILIRIPLWKPRNPKVCLVYKNEENSHS